MSHCRSRASEVGLRFRAIRALLVSVPFRMYSPSVLSYSFRSVGSSRASEGERSVGAMAGMPVLLMTLVSSRRQRCLGPALAMAGSREKVDLIMHYLHIDVLEVLQWVTVE